MKRSLQMIMLWVVVLASLSCSVTSGVSNSLLQSTPLSPDSQSFNEAVAAEDDISIAYFIKNELQLAELPTPYSPYKMCYEVNTQKVKTDSEGAFASHVVKDCGSSQEGDFALSSTIVLKSSAKAAACGYVFRSDGQGSWYELRLERSEDSSSWSLVRFADGVVAEVLREPAGDEDLDLANGKQTRVLLYARGEIIKVFFNNSFAGTVMDSALVTGSIQLFAEAESGAAECQYDDYWVNIYH